MIPNCKITEEVESNIKEGRIVALESSMVTQGLPWPKNFETMLKMEEAIYTEGAIPAIIAFLAGEIRVGLTHAELENLAKSKEAIKITISEIPWAQAKKLTGGTTVSSTVAIASRLGINIFATGGMGGVHRGKRTDISSDLVALSRFDMIVVCSGIKAFLDIDATLEILEMLGVPVVTYQSDKIPAFFGPNTCFKSKQRIDHFSEIINFARMKWDAELPGSILLFNPISKAMAVDEKELSWAIEESHQLASKQGIKGKELTPFILEQISHLTHGKSLKAIIELVINNAKLAGKIAKLSSLRYNLNSRDNTDDR